MTMPEDQKRAAVEAMARALCGGNPDDQIPIGYDNAGLVWGPRWRLREEDAQRQLRALLALGWRGPGEIHASDCAMNNGPAMEPGSCDCPRLDGFRAGAEAMREAAATKLDAIVNELTRMSKGEGLHPEAVDDLEMEIDVTAENARVVRALPLPSEGGGDG